MKVTKYKTIEYSEILLSELDKDTRIDAEYFQEEYLKYADLIKSKPNLCINEFAFVTDGIHSSINFDEDSNINLISAKAPKEFSFDLSGSGYISTVQHEQNLRTSLQLNDVIVSTVGTIGNCAIVTPEILPANCDRDAGIIRLSNNDEINPHFLTAYLNTKYGKAATMRETSGNVQLHLYIKNIKQLKIPKASFQFQEEVTKLVLKSHSEKLKSEMVYKQANDILLSELEVNEQESIGKDSEHYNYSSIHLSEALKFNRLDAEYWDTDYLELLSKLSKFNTAKLNSEISIHNGFPFQSKKFIEIGEGEPFIRIRDCKPHFIQTQNLTKLEESYVADLKVTKAQTGDIVIGMDGLKWFYGSLVVEPAFVNQRVCHIRLDPKSDFTPEYILLVINSKIGQVQLLRKMTIADTVGHIKNIDVANLIIPISKNIELISNKVKEVQLAQQKSKELIEVSKRAVEIFIEQNEEEALKYIQENTK